MLLLPHACDLMFFFFNDTATTEIYTLSLHDALPISIENLVVTAPTNNGKWWVLFRQPTATAYAAARGTQVSIFLWADRKSTRLNSSHSQISYAVFCLKKKKIHSV